MSYPFFPQLSHHISMLEFYDQIGAGGGVIWLRLTWILLPKSAPLAPSIIGKLWKQTQNLIFIDKQLVFQVIFFHFLQDLTKVSCAAGNE